MKFDRIPERLLPVADHRCACNGGNAGEFGFNGTILRLNRHALNDRTDKARQRRSVGVGIQVAILDAFPDAGFEGSQRLLLQPRDMRGDGPVFRSVSPCVGCQTVMNARTLSRASRPSRYPSANVARFNFTPP